MIKKLPVLLAILAALAIPSVASAESIVTNSLGETATEVHALSQNAVLTTALGVLQCTTVSFDITLTENNTETAVGNGTGEAVGSVTKGTHSGPCEAFPGVPTDFTSVTLTNLHLEANGTGSVDFETEYDITTMGGPILCSFYGKAALVYEEGSDLISFEAKLISASAPPCHTSGLLKGDFTVTDEFGEPAVIG